MLPHAIAEEKSDWCVEHHSLLWRHLHGSPGNDTIWIVRLGILHRAEGEDKVEPHDPPGSIIVILLQFLKPRIILRVHDNWKVVSIFSLGDS